MKTKIQNSLIALALFGGFHQANAQGIFVANYGGTISEFNSSGTLSQTFGSGPSGQGGLAFDSSGNLYAAFGNGTIAEYSPSGASLGTFASVGTVGSGEDVLRGLAFDSSGNLYVADSDKTDESIQEFSSSGASLGIFASVGAAPYSLAFDSSGNLYVATKNGISEYNSTGNLLQTFGSASAGGLAIGPNGNIFVSDQGSSVLEYSPSGVLLETFASGLNGAEGLAFDSNGDLYVANDGDLSGTTVSEFNSSGTLINTLTGLNGPTYIAISTVPEPAALTLASLGGMALFALRRRKFPWL